MSSSTTSRGYSTLQTPRLTLRPARGSDIYDFFELFSDPEVMRYWYDVISFALMAYANGLCSGQQLPTQKYLRRKHTSMEWCQQDGMEAVTS